MKKGEILLTSTPYWYKLKFMKISDFKKIQKDLGFTNQEIADTLKTSRRNIDNWRSGRIRVPGPVVVALYLLIEQKQI